MNKKTRSRAKRAVRIRLTITYSLMVISIILLVGALYLFVQGYRYNRFEGQLEQGGLVQFNSFPSNAAIWLGDSQLGVRTQSRLTISAGSHVISMRKDGYYDWTKQVLVQAGGVLWLHYIRLVPKQPVLTTMQTLSAVSSHAVSYDNKKVALIENAAHPVIQVFTTDSDTPQKTTLTLPSSSYTKPNSGDTETFKLVTWAHDNRYVLLQHTYGTSTEWLSVDTSNQNVVKNITQLLGVSAVDVMYAKDDANTLFVRDANADVRRINVDQKTISAPLLKNIESFNVYDNSTLTYVSKVDTTTQKVSVGYLTLNASASRVIAQYDASSAGKVLFMIGSYDGVRYLAAANGESVTVMTGDLPVSDVAQSSKFTTISTLTVAGGVRYMGFSPDQQRFLYAEGADAMASFDFDTRTAYRHTFSTTQSQSLSWLDSYHFTADASGGLGVYDFDGTNNHTVLPNTLDTTAVLSQNGKYLFAFQKTDNGVNLVRVSMTVDN